MKLPLPSRGALRFLLAAGVVSLLSPAWSQSADDKEKDEEARRRLQEMIENSRLPTGPRSLDPLVADAARLFGTGTDDFQKTFRPLRFEWTSSTKTQARFADTMIQGNQMTLFAGKLEPAEALVDFTDGKLSQITLLIFTRGDARKEIGPDDFAKMVADSKAGVSQALGDPGKDRGASTTGAVRGADGWVWSRPDVAALLEWSSQRVKDETGASTRRAFQAEFLRLRLVPPAKPGVGTKPSPGATVKRTDLAAHVKKDEASGDVWVADVPMVDQGQKGYCVVATCERLFRFYGMQVDQHELAQVAESSSGGGTDPDKMVDALRKLQMRLKLRMRELIGWDYRAFERELEVYNRGAKRKGVKIFDTKNYLFSQGVYAQMDKEVLREAKCRGAGFDKFKAWIKENTSAGVPLLWALEIGVYPEQGMENPQQGGGHMRLIIGFNEKKGQVIFTDSWGAGHEMKRMKIDDAFAVTAGLYLVEPNTN